jgi:50S ribosomal subunit-associated GTPase HflX
MLMAKPRRAGPFDLAAGNPGRTGQAATGTAVGVTIPYHRGDLVARLHDEGRVDATEHIEGGARIKAHVQAALAASLGEFATF